MKQDDEPTYEDVAWEEDMVSLAITAVAIITIGAFAVFGFWLAGWI